jgi:hypothetical protein
MTDIRVLIYFGGHYCGIWGQERFGCQKAGKKQVPRPLDQVRPALTRGVARYAKMGRNLPLNPSALG